jgi:hypothetical protein
MTPINFIPTTDYTCRKCKHMHHFVIDWADNGMAFSGSFKWCQECECNKAVLTNLEYIEYKYEQSIH